MGKFDGIFIASDMDGTLLDDTHASGRRSKHWSILRKTADISLWRPEERVRQRLRIESCCRATDPAFT